MHGVIEGIHRIGGSDDNGLGAESADLFGQGLDYGKAVMEKLHSVVDKSPWGPCRNDTRPIRQDRNIPPDRSVLIPVKAV
jgi:hypothetical protein